MSPGAWGQVSSPAYSVRRGHVPDARLLRAIRLESLRDTPEAFGATFEEASTWSDDRWRTAAQQWTYYLGEGEGEGEVVGMVSGGFNDRSPGTLWMYGMYVSPTARGTGLASELVEAVGQWALGEGASELYLHVTETVTRARAFYEKVGFRLTGDAITMSRDPSLRLVTMVKSLG